MTKEQVEEIIYYLNNNKNNLPNSIVESLQHLYDKIEFENTSLDTVSMNHAFSLDNLDDNTLDFIINNQDVLANNNLSTEECNVLQNNHTATRLKQIKEIEDSFSSINFQPYPKDDGSNYPINVPPILSKEEVYNKMISFPEEVNHKYSKEIDDINEHIKAFHEQHKIKQLETVKEKNKHQLENTIEWIKLSEVEKLLEDFSSFGTPDKVAKLKKYVEKVETSKKILEINDFTIFNSLNEDCPNFKEVSKFYKGSFVLNHSKYNHDKSYHTPSPILLLGEPGIGKTHFAKKLAKVLGTSFHFLDSNSITASWVLTGSSGQWQNADAGNIFKYMLDSNTISPVVILDEIDKLAQGKNYDPFSVFHQMFEGENAKNFKDEFLNITFDASNIIYILTANNINHIPESLLSRMRIFDITRPNEEEMKVITKNIYKELIGQTPLLNPEIPEDILNKLIGLAPRDIKKQISNAVFSQLADCQDSNQTLILDIKPIGKNWGF